ncbi:hypothetical protein F52700_4524 [Fusarium sp. NRRL 52700]|nr:hypothetical protein F52700_4524 [Fusarium sp. NRRL 52700]
MSEPYSNNESTHVHTIWRKREREFSRTQKLVGKVTGTPEKKLHKFILKHEIIWNSQWDDKLRLTVPLKDKSPEQTLANLGVLMQDEGLAEYWEIDCITVNLLALVAWYNTVTWGLEFRPSDNHFTRTINNETTVKIMGAITAKKFREFSDRWNEDFRHYYFVKNENGYYPSLCHFISKYKGKYEVNFDNVKETLHIVLPKDEYYHKGLHAQKAIKKELEKAMAKDMPRYWVKDEARHRDIEALFTCEVERHYREEEAREQRRRK